MNLLNTQQVADILKCSKRTLDTYRIRQGKKRKPLPYIKKRNLVFYEADALAAWMAEVDYRIPTPL